MSAPAICYNHRVLDLEKIAPEGPRPIRRTEYERLVALGFFEGEHLELLYGWLVKMTPQGAPHASVVQKLNKLLLPALLGRAEVRIQSSFAASDMSEPEPDVAVVPPGEYKAEHPRVAWLLVEVAVSSKKRDREVKACLYAEAGVTEYWIVDVAAETVEVHRGPSDGRYSTLTTHRRGERLTVERFSDIVFDVDALF